MSIVVKLIADRLPKDLVSSEPTKTAIVVTPLAATYLPLVDKYPGKLPFYHIGVLVNDIVYEYVGSVLTECKDGGSRYELVKNVIETPFGSYSEVEKIYLHDNVQEKILVRYHQLVTEGHAVHPDLKPYYDFAWCNCEHIATFLVTGYPNCSQLDHIEEVLGGRVVIDDIIGWLSKILNEHIDQKFAEHPAEGYLAKFFAKALIEGLVLETSTIVNKETVLFLRRAVNTVISDFGIPVSVYSGLVPAFGMIPE